MTDAMGPSLHQAAAPTQNTQSATDPATPKNATLWAVVIGLGIAIVIVLALIVGLALQRSFFGAKPARAPQDVTAPIAAAPAPVFDLPVDATIAETRVEGGLIVVRMTTASGDEILVIDPETGRLKTRIRFKRKAGP